MDATLLRGPASTPLPQRFNAAGRLLRHSAQRGERLACLDDHRQLSYAVTDRIAPCTYPREIGFIGELPTTATGKIQRFRLRERG